MSGNVLWSYFVRGRQCPITSRRMCFCIINLAFVKYFGHNFNCSQMAIWPVWTCWLKNFQLFCCPPILKLPTSGNIFVALFMRPFYLFYLFIRPGSTRPSSAGPSRWLCPSRHLERSNPMERSDRKIQLSFPLSREMVKSPVEERKHWHERNSTVPLYFHIWHGFSITLQIILAGGWKSEMSIFWCISMPNNVKNWNFSKL